MSSTWQNIPISPRKKYSGTSSADVVIVGGGITGISTAYLLAKAGKKVVLLEKEELKETTTAYTTAFLTSNIDTLFTEIQKVYGMGTAKKIIDSHEVAIDTIEKIIHEEKIECEFKRTEHYNLAFHKDSLKKLQEEKEIRVQAGHLATMVGAKTFPFPNAGALQIKDQAKFHPLKYLAELRKRAEVYGAQFFEHSKVLSIKGNKTITVTTAKGKIMAKNVVIATYQPFDEPLSFVWKKGMYVSYVLELKVPKREWSEMLIEDDANPYHYIRVDSISTTHNRIIVGGQDHRKEIKLDPNRGFNALEDFAKHKLMLSQYEIVTKWAGSILESSDGLAFIGQQSDKFPNRYVATAFSGNGMTYGTLSAMIISDAINCKKNSYSKVYDPRRTISAQGLLLKARDYGEEFIHGVSDNLSHSKNKKA